MNVRNYFTGLPHFHFDEAAAGAGGAAGASGAGGGAAAAWHTGLDAEIVGTAQNKGWDMSDATKAFAAAAQAYSGAQKLIGAPPDKVLRMPEPSAEPAVLDAFWQRLGAAKEAKEIDLSSVKAADGKPFDEKLAEVIRATALAARAPKDIVTAIAAGLQKHFDAETSTRATLMADTIRTEQQALDQSWGANKAANLFIANQALEKLAAAAQVPPDKAKAAWDALSKVGGIGASAAMNMLFEMGKRMGEDRFVKGGGGDNMPMTREAAVAEINQLKADQGFRDKLLKGDKESTDRWTALHRIGFGRQAA